MEYYKMQRLRIQPLVKYTNAYFRPVNGSKWHYLIQLKQMSNPTQYNTPCYVVSIIDDYKSERVEFSDLQMAYLHCKNMLANSDRIWHMKSWKTTIQLLYEYHAEDGSGIDVARSVEGDVVSIFYRV